MIKVVTYTTKYQGNSVKRILQSYNTKFAFVSVCGRNSLPNNAYFCDETFTGDSKGLE